MVREIGRLYRIRNELMHATRVNYDLIHFATSLNIYLRIILSDVIFKLCTKRLQSIEDILMYLEDNYEGIISRLEYSKKLEFNNELVIKGAF